MAEQPEYIKPIPLNLKTHPSLNEKWVQQRIAEDPAIVGLGDLILRDKERPQPYAGRLDLLLEDLNADHRYEVEIQLGKTDPSHIIRTIEYWDIECKRYPQYDHTAVIVAEEITSRFLNVISLFNRAIPLVAIQMQALELEDKVTLVFTTILDERHIGPEPPVIEKVVPRTWWEERSPGVMHIADGLLDLLNQSDPGWKLKYNERNLHLQRNGKTSTFMRLRPRKRDVLLILSVDESTEFSALVDASGLATLSYLHAYRLVVRDDDLKERAAAIRTLIQQASASEQEEAEG